MNSRRVLDSFCHCPLPHHSKQPQRWAGAGQGQGAAQSAYSRIICASSIALSMALRSIALLSVKPSLR